MTSRKRAKVITPVIDAVLARDISRLRTAIEAGGHIDGRDSDGRTALHHASIQKQGNVVKLLVGFGAQVAAVDKDGLTPLHFAAVNYDVDVATTLLGAGAPVDAADSHGNTPLFRAVFQSRGRGELIKLLLEAGADRHRENNYGTTPAALAATIANYDVKQWLTP